MSTIRQVLTSEYPQVQNIELRLTCPHCRIYTSLSLIGYGGIERIEQWAHAEQGAIYRCLQCDKTIFILWEVVDREYQYIDNPKLVTPEYIPFDYDHVPAEVRKEIEEALLCFSVKAYNGFAAICRRALQVICTQAGATGSSKVQKQILELKEEMSIDDSDFEAIKVIMLTGHDGTHPHLPEVTNKRADLLLEILRDVTYQLYTRPGKLREARDQRNSNKK